MATRQPSAASARADANPRPRLAAVTNARRPRSPVSTAQLCVRGTGGTCRGQVAYMRCDPNDPVATQQPCSRGGRRARRYRVGDPGQFRGSGVAPLWSLADCTARNSVPHADGCSDAGRLSDVGASGRCHRSLVHVLSSGGGHHRNGRVHPVATSRFGCVLRRARRRYDVRADPSCPRGAIQPPWHIPLPRQSVGRRQGTIIVSGGTRPGPAFETR
jgi:hypothetical protein